MIQDRNFDGLANRFEDEIYKTSKGFIRLNVLWNDLTDVIPSVQKGNLSVLDAGGGLGQIAIKLAELGNRVTLCDPSEEMLSKALKSIKKEGLDNKIELVHSGIQDFKNKINKKYDLVLCHAVLEWLQFPKDVLVQLIELIKRRGTLSLMFFNKNAVLLETVLKGDLDTSIKYFKEKKLISSGFTEKSTPLDPIDVYGWINEMGLKIIHKSGIRIFHDHIQNIIDNDEKKLKKLLKLEVDVKSREPFSWLGQHMHYVCKLK